MFNKLKHRRFENAIEIGCSYGFFLPALCIISENVFAFDLEKTLKFCEPRTLKAILGDHKKIRLCSGNVRQLSEIFPRDYFDLICSFSMLEHVAEDEREPYAGKEKALIEMAKCLKPNGIFVVELPSENLLYRTCAKVSTGGESHKNYKYIYVKQLIDKYFKEEKVHNRPFGIPLFKIGFYKKK